MIGKDTVRAAFYPKRKLYKELLKEAKKQEISFSELMNEISEEHVNKKK